MEIRVWEGSRNRKTLNWDGDGDKGFGNGENELRTWGVDEGRNNEAIESRGCFPRVSSTEVYGVGSNEFLDCLNPTLGKSKSGKYAVLWIYNISGLNLYVIF